ncbi:hypothetical protein HCD_01025 [Helicobacter cetorum MIT 99-5656]|uniref:Uncharacterized protein n=1 Tax=Helicobacter cetorum (strain ATCC BAA-540 / CCUG 52418 / MIT 99-5656) TaxID=1163745 RepID=I0EQL8_HELCM|nr:hypothetical protein HCD_01025 [Helicobacter cetorum MIT 99-5656]
MIKLKHPYITNQLLRFLTMRFLTKPYLILKLFNIFMNQAHKNRTTISNHILNKRNENKTKKFQLVLIAILLGPSDT